MKNEVELVTANLTLTACLWSEGIPLIRTYNRDGRIAFVFKETERARAIRHELEYLRDYRGDVLRFVEGQNWARDMIRAQRFSGGMEHGG